MNETTETPDAGPIDAVAPTAGTYGAKAPDPRDIARGVALATAEADGQVGGFLRRIDVGDGVSDFRFEATVPGYERWQWSITLFHNEDDDSWTVDESTLIPGDDALMPPKWIPWKERLLPTDLSVTDALGTDPDDERIEEGVPADDATGESDGFDLSADGGQSADPVDRAGSDADSTGSTAERTGHSDGEPDAGDGQDGVAGADGEGAQASATSGIDRAEAIEEFDLSRRHVLSALGRSQTARRWYEGPHGPKSLSTKTAAGQTCSTCGFFVPLKGELNLMFGVCANKWSLDDGKVVSLDHGCGEHSEIKPPEPTHLWRQTKPAFDDMRIDIIHQVPREESGAVELIEDRLATRDERGGNRVDDGPEDVDRDGREGGKAVGRPAGSAAAIDSDAPVDSDACVDPADAVGIAQDASDAGLDEVRTVDVIEARSVSVEVESGQSDDPAQPAAVAERDVERSDVAVEVTDDADEASQQSDGVDADGSDGETDHAVQDSTTADDGENPTD